MALPRSGGDLTDEDLNWLHSIYCDGMPGSFIAGETENSLDCELFYYDDEDQLIVHQALS